MERKLHCVLLVDDDEGTNYFNRVIIERANVAEQIKTTLNGKEALEYLTNSGEYYTSSSDYPGPALILLDINMPVMDGWDFIEEYERLPDAQRGKIVIVMLSTSTNPDDRMKAGKFSSISGFRNKPLSVNVVKELINEYFNELN